MILPVQKEPTEVMTMAEINTTSYGISRNDNSNRLKGITSTGGSSRYRERQEGHHLSTMRNIGSYKFQNLPKKSLPTLGTDR